MSYRGGGLREIPSSLSYLSSSSFSHFGLFEVHHPTHKGRLVVRSCPLGRHGSGDIVFETTQNINEWSPILASLLDAVDLYRVRNGVPHTEHERMIIGLASCQMPYLDLCRVPNDVPGWYFRETGVGELTQK